MSALETRYLYQAIREDLATKMVFIAGPRQVGKTTLAQQFIANYEDGHPAYLNYDFFEHRAKIRGRQWPASEKIIILDEIHKMREWRNLVKGFYDTLKNSHQFIITGSARLDHCNRGGDSLLGRYRYYRLHPFTLNELGNRPENLEALFEFGGFPEPLLGRDKRNLRRWHLERIHRLIETDLRDLERVNDMEKMRLLAESLPARVGSPLSVKSLAEDLLVDFKTVKRWLGLLNLIYYCYQIPPFGSPKIRAVKKEQKLYLWDYSQIEEPGIRFENMVAGQLLKFCHFLEDYQGYKMELRYIRDTDKREVDFVVLKSGQPLFAVECKMKNRKLSPHLRYFRDRTAIPKFYQVGYETTRHQQVDDQISLLPFTDFCRLTKMP